MEDFCIAFFFRKKYFCPKPYMFRKKVFYKDTMKLFCLYNSLIPQSVDDKMQQMHFHFSFTNHILHISAT